MAESVSTGLMVITVDATMALWDYGAKRVSFQTHFLYRFNYPVDGDSQKK